MRKFIWLIVLSSGITAFAQEVGFDRALEIMVSQDVDVLVQNSKLSASGSQLDAAWGAFTPNVNLLAQQQNSGGNAPGASSLGLYEPSKMYGLNATWNLFRFGADAAGLRAARMDQSFQQSALDNTYLQAEEKAARALLDMVARKQTVEALKRSEDSVLHYLEIAQARYKKSLLSREETDKFALDAANAEAQRADAEIAFNTASANVVALLGNSQVKLAWPWEKYFDTTAVRNLLNEKVERALAVRPDIRSARTALEAEEARTRFYLRSMLPTIDLNYTVGETHAGGNTVSDWSSLVTLTVPLWSGLRDYSAYKGQVATKVQADVRLRQAERSVRGSVESAQLNFKVARGQSEARLRNLATARHILDQDAARFRVGRADANDLNLGLARVTSAELLAIQGLEQVHLAYIRLHHEFGRRLIGF